MFLVFIIVMDRYKIYVEGNFLKCYFNYKGYKNNFSIFIWFYFLIYINYIEVGRFYSFL